MKERPMIFNAEMVRAILDGRKTQTRRIIKFPFIDKNIGCELAGNELAAEVNAGDYRNCTLCPGDRLWVRETFASGLSTKSTLAYRATHKRQDLEDGFYETIKWTPSIHMPRWASRINLEITGVRVERLQSISDEDVDAEGFAGDYPTSALPSLFPGEPSDWSHLSMRDCYGVLWKSIYGEESWQSNPWVWVIEFKRIEGGAA